MKKSLLYISALAALMLAGCAQDTNPDVPVVIPDPVLVYEGSGNLLLEGETETPHTYSWEAESGLVIINVNIDTETAVNAGAFELGLFELPTSQLNEFLGAFVGSELDESSFYALEPDGSFVEEFTSYKPGMWVDENSFSCNWSNGAMYWQWYVWEGKTDKNGKIISYDYENKNAMFIIGTNPSNVAKVSGKTLTSNNKIVVGDNFFDFVVNVSFSEYAPEGGEEVKEPETKMDYLMNGSYPYQAAAQGAHQYNWSMDENGITVNVDAYIPAIEDWGYLMIGIDPEAMTEYLGIEDINQLADLTYFYPVNADGEPSVDAEGNLSWTSYAPGQWVDSEGAASNWSSGTLFWQYQFGDNKYENHYTEGLLVIGTNPDNITALAGTTVTSKAKIGDKDFTVNVNYIDAYPTSGSGVIGANSYSWELVDNAFNVVANVSVAALDDTWGIFGFPINTTYVNEFFDTTIETLDIESFYPVNADGEPSVDADGKLSWSSYEPGQWFLADGSRGLWNSGVAFWQYYTANTYDYDLPNLFYIGKNPDFNAERVAGQSYVSKAKLAGHDMTFTINFVD